MGLEYFTSREVYSVDMDDELSKVKDLFSEHKIHHMLVTDGGKLIGVLNDRDLYKQLSPTLGTAKETHSDIELLHKKVHLIMNRNLVTITADTSINQAVLKLNDNKVSCLPIVDEKNRPIGIITWRDILGMVAKQYRHKLKKKQEKADK